MKELVYGAITLLILFSIMLFSINQILIMTFGHGMHF